MQFFKFAMLICTRHYVATRTSHILFAMIGSTLQGDSADREHAARSTRRVSVASAVQAAGLKLRELNLQLFQD